MSSAASTPPGTDGPVDANAARPRLSRTPLSVVPRRTVRRSRVSTVVVCTLALTAALLGILVLNIQISSGQYRLTELTAQQRAVSQENEALTQDIEANAAPQNLAVRANDLGMVQAKDVGTVNLSTGAVSPPDEAAGSSGSEDILVPPARLKGSEAAENNRKAAEARAQKRAEEEAAKKAAERKAAQDARDESPRENLNGGTVPAPAQRSPGE